MFPDPYPFVTPRRHPNSLTLHITLRGAPSRRRRRVFFSRLYAESRRLGLVFSQKLGLCVFFGAERICTSAHRQQLVHWLIDQPEVAAVDVGPLGHLGDLVQSKPPTTTHRLTLGAMPEPATKSTPFPPQARRVALGVVAQWIGYLNGAIR